MDLTLGELWHWFGAKACQVVDDLIHPSFIYITPLNRDHYIPGVQFIPQEPPPLLTKAAPDKAQVEIDLIVEVKRITVATLGQIPQGLLAACPPDTLKFVPGQVAAKNASDEISWIRMKGSVNGIGDILVVEHAQTIQAQIDHYRDYRKHRRPVEFPWNKKPLQDEKPN